MKVIYRLSFSLEQTKTFPYKRGSTGIKPFDCKLFRNKKWKRGDGGRGRLIYAGQYRAMKATYGRSTFVGATHTEFDKLSYKPRCPRNHLLPVETLQQFVNCIVISGTNFLNEYNIISQNDLKNEMRHPYILNGSDELIGWWRVVSIKVYSVEEYRKIKKIRPGAYIFQRPFLKGLFLEGLYSQGLIYGGKSIGLTL